MCVLHPALNPASSASLREFLFCYQTELKASRMPFGKIAFSTREALCGFGVKMGVRLNLREKAEFVSVKQPAWGYLEGQGDEIPSMDYVFPLREQTIANLEEIYRESGM